MRSIKSLGEAGGTYVTALFWNPDTKETKSVCVRDYDYADCSRDNDELYHMAINEEMRKSYYAYVAHSVGRAVEGDLVEVYKGRKVPKGTRGIVVNIKAITDRYGRWVADYVYLDNGYKTNMDNCKLVQEENK